MAHPPFELGVVYPALESAVPDGDLELIERLSRAEPAAVGEAYDRHHRALREFARHLVGDPATAEDLLHEVFVTLPRAVKSFRGQSSLRTFLLSIAVNHARHHVRAATRRRRAFERYALEPPEDVAGPDQETRRKELAHALTRALDALPLDQRLAFVLCEVEERSSVEVAEIVGAPEGTVRTRLFHAKKKLRSWFQQEGLR